MDKSILEVVHESAKDLYAAKIIDAVTMREYDGLCLPELHPMNSKEIKKIRLREKVSQPILAKYLNVSPSTVKHWERGEKRPSGAALKLLNILNSKGLAALI